MVSRKYSEKRKRMTAKKRKTKTKPKAQARTLTQARAQAQARTQAQAQARARARARARAHRNTKNKTQRKKSANRKKIIVSRRKSGKKRTGGANTGFVQLAISPSLVFEGNNVQVRSSVQEAGIDERLAAIHNRDDRRNVFVKTLQVLQPTKEDARTRTRTHKRTR